MRTSGILLPISSLPSPYGIGCFDKEAYAFVDQLQKAKQTYWQILPLGITSYGDSPYQSFSTYAGNPYFIDLNQLVEKGWLEKEDLVEPTTSAAYVDYSFIYTTRYPLLRKAFLNSNIADNKDFQEWCKQEAWWLDDYTLFMAIKKNYGNQSWDTWPKDLRLRNPKALDKMRNDLEDEILFNQFIQYEVWTQWNQLKAYANAHEVQIIGDIPIYVAFDSCDVWANPQLFQLDENLNPTAVAGCPPDGFSADGQLWGNPLYNWPIHKQTGYQWWINRMAYCKDHYDVVRIDHFRGFDEYFSIPFGDSNARRGHWEKGPGYELFKSIEDELGKMNVIAEDLGYLTESVKQMVADCGYPGMKVLQFAFDSRDSSGASAYLPHNYTENTVVYTGTHDNETMMGWFNSITSQEMQDLKNYLNTQTNQHEELLDLCISLIMHSVSNMCIIPMQDLLKLDNSSRLNIPNTLGVNWKWRMTSLMDESLIEKLKQITIESNRI